MDNNENFSLFRLLFTSDYDDQIQETVKKIREMIDVFRNIDWQKIIDTFSKLPDKIKDSVQTWANYGWVPNLPAYTAIDLMRNLNAPQSKSEADNIMNNKIDNEMFSLLITEIKNYNTQSGLNDETFKEAVECFNTKLYSACALLLFALIDSCFLINQPKIKKRRDLANKAVSRAINESKANNSIIVLTSKTIIEKLFLDGDDFDYSREQGLNRNFISHGMNKYNPNRTDCIKLFVLIYNIFFLFNVNFFTWSKP